MSINEVSVKDCITNACKKYIIQTREEEKRGKYIIIVGELGAGDGTVGIYNKKQNKKRLLLPTLLCRRCTMRQQPVPELFHLVSA